MLRGRIVNVYGGFGFLKQLGNDSDGQDIFFRAADVIGGSRLKSASIQFNVAVLVLRNRHELHGARHGFDGMLPPEMIPVDWVQPRYGDSPSEVTIRP